MADGPVRLVLVLLFFVLDGDATHFRGGHISVSVTGTPPNSLLHITSIHGIRREFQTCEPNNVVHVIELGNGEEDNLVIPMNCSQTNLAAWDLYEGSATYSLSGSNGIIRVVYEGGDWIAEFGNAGWYIYTEVDVSSVRNDTGKYNSSPRVVGPLVLEILSGCPVFTIPIIDPDLNDIVRCREAIGSECGVLCNYNQFRPGVITQDCRLDFTADMPSGGPYLVNMITEDFATSTSTQALSQVFAQYLLRFDTQVPATLTSQDPSPHDTELPLGLTPTHTFSLQYAIDIFNPNLTARVSFVSFDTPSTVHYAIDVQSAAGKSQMTYLRRRVEIRPAFDFSVLEGQKVSVLLEAGVVGSLDCRTVNIPVTDPNFWFFNVERPNVKGSVLWAGETFTADLNDVTSSAFTALAAKFVNVIQPKLTGFTQTAGGAGIQIQMTRVFAFAVTTPRDTAVLGSNSPGITVHFKVFIDGSTNGLVDRFQSNAVQVLVGNQFPRVWFGGSECILNLCEEICRTDPGGRAICEFAFEATVLVEGSLYSTNYTRNTSRLFIALASTFVNQVDTSVGTVIGMEYVRTAVLAVGPPSVQDRVILSGAAGLVVHWRVILTAKATTGHASDLQTMFDLTSGPLRFIYINVGDAPCRGNPCKQGGTCVETGGSFVCTCQQSSLVVNSVCDFYLAGHMLLEGIPFGVNYMNPDSQAHTQLAVSFANQVQSSIGNILGQIFIKVAVVGFSPPSAMDTLILGARLGLIARFQVFLTFPGSDAIRNELQRRFSASGSIRYFVFGTDPCVRNPCDSSQLCIANATSYTCKCEDGVQSSICFGDGVYPYGPDANDRTLTTFSTKLDLEGDKLTFFDKAYEKIFVTRNGYVNFVKQVILIGARKNAEMDFTKYWMSSRAVLPPILAVHLSAHISTSQLYHHDYYRRCGHETNNVLKVATDEMRKYGLSANFTALHAIIVTWKDMKPYTKSQDVGSATFQLRLVSDGVRTVALYHYAKSTWKLNQPIHIGWHYNVTRQETNPHSFTSRASSIADEIGNTGEKGKWMYKLYADGTPSAATQCYTWYTKERCVSRPTPGKPRCPCNSNTARRDRRWFFWKTRNGLNCYIRRGRPQGRHWHPICCYGQASNGLVTLVDGTIGYMSLYHPELQVADLAREEAARSQCCADPSTCYLFYTLRPSSTCDGYVPSRRGGLFGDPHIVTLDNLTYTFNGWGDYTLLRSPLFNLQGRTGPVVFTERTNTTATVWVAYAAKSTHSSRVEVAINRTSNTLHLWIDGIPEPTLVALDVGGTIEGNNVTVVKSDSQSLDVVFPDDVILTVTVAAGGQLIADPQIPEGLFGQTYGLLGTFNDDPADDLTIPNGTVLSTALNQEELFYMFGQKWRVVMADSLFAYTDGTYAYYNPTGHVPAFTTVFDNEATQMQAEEVCQGSSACLFDFSQSNDPAFSNLTRTTTINIIETTSILANNPPMLNGTKALHVTVGMEHTYAFTASDADSDDVTVMVVGSLPSNANFSQKDNIGTLVWTPQALERTNIMFFAVDTNGAESQILAVEVRACTCMNGSCAFGTTVQHTTNSALYQVVQCECQIGFEGKECSMDSPGCDGDPCVGADSCEDLTPTEEAASGIGFRCVGCQAGYTELDGQCIDIDECENATIMCDQACTNALGSYSCDCYPGYELKGEICEDMDECKNTSTCMQRCHNSVGTYYCSCYSGYIFNNGNCDDINECVKVTCPTGMQCMNTPGNFTCSCPSGHVFANGQCSDMNECDSYPKPCEQLCTNLMGHYTCSCFPGYVLTAGKCVVPPDVASDRRRVYGLRFEIVSPPYTPSLQNTDSPAFKSLTVAIRKVNDAFLRRYGSSRFSEAMIVSIKASSSDSKAVFMRRSMRTLLSPMSRAMVTTFLDMNFLFTSAADVTASDVTSTFLSAFTNNMIEGSGGTSYELAPSSVLVKLLNPGKGPNPEPNKLVIILFSALSLVVLLLVPTLIIVCVRYNNGNIPSFCQGRFGNREPKQILIQQNPFQQYQHQGQLPFIFNRAVTVMRPTGSHAQQLPRVAPPVTEVLYRNAPSQMLLPNPQTNFRRSVAVYTVPTPRQPTLVRLA